MTLSDFLPHGRCLAKAGLNKREEFETVDFARAWVEAQFNQSQQ